MKLLIIGIDGGDSRIIRAMDMPFLKGVLDGGASLHPEEDLFSRGWVEILTGKPGHETGAFYTKPVAQKKGARATQSFSARDYKRIAAEPLWQRLNRDGLRVGFMNIPTTHPAPEVDGFFVAGAGGGLGAGNVSPSAVFPAQAADVLSDEKYIFDTRYMSSGIREREAFLHRLRIMSERRVNTYLRLAEAYTPDVGFVAFMALKGIQYLAMQEIEEMIAARGSGEEWTAEQSAIGELFRDFDQQLERLVTTLNPENIMVVSDHGQAPYKHAVNVGNFLEHHQWQVRRSSTSLGIRRGLKIQIKKLLPRAWTKRLSKSAALRSAVGTESAVDFARSRAFGVRYVPGIYLNDERFDGPVRGESEKKELSDTIMQAFNTDPNAMKYGLSARLGRALNAEAPAADLLPDIWIDRPDTVFFEYGVGQSQPEPNALVVPNPAYGHPIDWSSVTHDQWTGIKGRHPLLVVLSPGYRAPEDLPNNLTAAYSIALELCK